MTVFHKISLQVPCSSFLHPPFVTHMKTTPLGEVKRLQEKGNKKNNKSKDNEQVRFHQARQPPFWHTVDNDIECRIISTPEKVDSDSIILISTSSSETEVLASELLPIGSSRSHKEEFMRWKKEREAEGMEFFSRLSEVMETDSDLAVGDMVAFTNDYGVVFGPKEVLAFRKPWNGYRCVYIDSDAYWFPDRPEQLTILSKGGTE